MILFPAKLSFLEAAWLCVVHIAAVAFHEISRCIGHIGSTLLYTRAGYGTRLHGGIRSMADHRVHFLKQTITTTRIDNVVCHAGNSKIADNANDQEDEISGVC